MVASRTPDVVAFPPFELDRRSGELRKHGARIRLADQPLQILLLLLDRPGDVIMRDEIRQRLWSSDTFVDFDAGLSSAVRKLREALGDSADRPRFVETIPRRGYRFIGTVATRESASTASPVSPPVPVAAPPPVPVTPRRYGQGALLVLVVTMGVVALYARGGSWRPAAAPAVVPARIDPIAYDAYLKGLSVKGQGTATGFRTAVGYFEQAIARQPDFAAAYADLAQAQLQFIYAGQWRPRDVVPKAEAAARRAVKLDPALPLAHRVLGAILHNYYWRWEEGDRELQRALDLDPDSVDALTDRAFALIREGRFDEAIAQTERARGRDPLSFAAAMNVGSALRAAGRYEAAIAEFRRALTIDSAGARAHLQIGATLGFMQRWPEAVQELDLAVRSRPDNTRFQAYLGYAEAKAGRASDARRILGALEERAKREYVSSFGLALLHDALGEKELAIAALQRAFEDHAVEFAQLKQYPPFQSILDDPRYDTVMRGVRRPE